MKKDLNESLGPTDYQLKKDENEAIFYRTEPHSTIPQVSEAFNPTSIRNNCDW